MKMHVLGEKAMSLIPENDEENLLMLWLMEQKKDREVIFTIKGERLATLSLNDCTKKRDPTPPIEVSAKGYINITVGQMLPRAAEYRT